MLTYCIIERYIHWLLRQLWLRQIVKYCFHFHFVVRTGAQKSHHTALGISGLLQEVVRNKDVASGYHRI